MNRSQLLSIAVRTGPFDVQLLDTFREPVASGVYAYPIETGGLGGVRRTVVGK